MGTSILHIKTEVECRVFLFDEEKGIATPGKYFNLEVRKGEQDLRFVSTSNEDIQCLLHYQIEELDRDYRIILDKLQFINIMIELLSEEVTDEEIAKGIEDDFGVVYSSDGSQLLQCKNDLSSYQIKQGCRIIRPDAFDSSSHLSSISMPDGLTHIGNHAFHGCELNSIALPESIKHIGDCAFYACGNLSNITLPIGLNHIGRAAFSHCYKLDNINLPNSLTRIEDEVFLMCINLANISLPTGLEQIGDMAFSGCEKLESLSIPDTLMHIGNCAFKNCINLSEIIFPANLHHIGDAAFYDTNIKSIVNNSQHISFNNGCLIDKNEKKLIAFLSDDESVELPEGLTHVGDCAFKKCENLTTITLPNGLTHIGAYAFSGCINLNDITLPDSMEEIKEYAFSDCRKLSNINLPIGLTSIDDGVFCDCEKLSQIILPSNLTYIGERAFEGCRSLSAVDLPEGLICIRDYAFDETIIDTIILPDSLSEIYTYAFVGCEKLSNIYVSAYMKDYFGKLLSDDLNQMLKEKPDNSGCYYYLFFDTETTGVPQDYNAPASDTKNWPRLVQLGWILTDESGNEISSGNEIVKPDGFVIPSEASCVHGITTEVALRDGKPLKQVIEAFIKDTNGIKFFVGHNVSFDQKVVGAELYRLGIADTISTARSLDTMKAATDYCKIPGSYGYKWPKLIELHRKLFGCDFEDAHDAMADITATKKCFFEMKRRNLI